MVPSKHTRKAGTIPYAIPVTKLRRRILFLMNRVNRLAWRLLDFSFPRAAATLSKGTQRGGVVDGALASRLAGSAVSPIAVDAAVLAILTARREGCDSGFLVQVGQVGSNEGRDLLVSVVGARPTTVCAPSTMDVPFSWAIGALRALGSLQVILCGI